MNFLFDFDDFLKPRIWIRGEEKGGIGRLSRQTTKGRLHAFAPRMKQKRDEAKKGAKAAE